MARCVPLAQVVDDVLHVRLVVAEVDVDVEPAHVRDLVRVAVPARFAAGGVVRVVVGHAGVQLVGGPPVRFLAVWERGVELPLEVSMPVVLRGAAIS